MCRRKAGNSVLPSTTALSYEVSSPSAAPYRRHLDDGRTLEVTRCCTDGAKNAASMLYGAAWRATKALGYRRLITYTLAEEPGTSLRAAGWTVVAESPGGRGIEQTG